MFKLTLTTDLPQKLQAAAANLDARMASLLQQCGVFIASEQQFSFEDKSRGGGGADGKPWKKLKESTERRKALKGIRKPKARKDGTRKRKSLPGTVPKSQIGVDRGMLRNAARQGFKGPDGEFTINGTTLVLKYAKSYAGYFDELRPLFPDDSRMPDAWRTGIENIMSEWAADILKDIN